ncbi:hypothetical protein EMMF5_003802 [Cystobasidiomycetes sp. EMM_F5]
MNAIETCLKYIRDLGLAPHPEGGFFVVTYVSDILIPSPVASRRAKYTLIRIPASHKLGTGSNAAELAPKGAPVSTTATDNGAGSVDVREINVGASTDDPMQLIVGKGWWKRSELVDENGYCLISETVMPGWHPNDHAFLSRSDLAELFPGNEAWVKANERHTLETVIFT